MQAAMERGLLPLNDQDGVADVRILGAIGVVDLKQPVDMKTIVPAFIEAGVWVRPFGRLVYLMPPYSMTDDDLAVLTGAVVAVVSAHLQV